jgi:hypothetical protein
MEIPKCVEYDTKMKTDSCHINDKSYCSNSTNQEWIYNKESKQIISKMSPNKCLDIYTHKVTGRSVQTYDCDNTIETQKWEYNEADHTIKTGNKCLSSFKNDEVTEIWGGKLSNDEYALLLVNRASITTKIEVSFEDLNLFDEKKVKLRDLWEKKDLGEFEEKYSVLLESHDSQFLRVTPIEDNSKLIMIIIIALAGVIFICTILVLAFYIKMRKNTPKSLDGLDGNDKFLDNDVEVIIPMSKCFCGHKYKLKEFEELKKEMEKFDQRNYISIIDQTIKNNLIRKCVLCEEIFSNKGEFIELNLIDQKRHLLCEKCKKKKNINIENNNSDPVEFHCLFCNSKHYIKPDLNCIII